MTNFGVNMSNHRGFWAVALRKGTPLRCVRSWNDENFASSLPCGKQALHRQVSNAVGDVGIPDAGPSCLRFFFFCVTENTKMGANSCGITGRSINAQEYKHFKGKLWLHHSTDTVETLHKVMSCFPCESKGSPQRGLSAAETISIS